MDFFFVTALVLFAIAAVSMPLLEKIQSQGREKYRKQISAVIIVALTYSLFLIALFVLEVIKKTALSELAAHAVLDIFPIYLIWTLVEPLTQHSKNDTGQP